MFIYLAKLHQIEAQIQNEKEKLQDSHNSKVKELVTQNGQLKSTSLELINRIRDMGVRYNNLCLEHEETQLKSKLREVELLNEIQILTDKYESKKKFIASVERI